jgi:hypothetical protein
MCGHRFNTGKPSNSALRSSNSKKNPKTKTNPPPPTQSIIDTHFLFKKIFIEEGFLKRTSENHFLKPYLPAYAKSTFGRAANIRRWKETQISKSSSSSQAVKQSTGKSNM